MPPSNGFLTSLNGIFSPHDMKRLEAYTNNLADFHMVRSPAAFFVANGNRNGSHDFRYY